MHAPNAPRTNTCYYIPVFFAVFEFGLDNVGDLTARYWQRAHELWLEFLFTINYQC